ncbi:outer membrane protein assembly factor BamB family protein [Natrinema salaciae]|uniref:Outer membrane protein assembly factor BamB, contains PQQ-like beta-propeller repeat n=1 Tax=Natrinema salaciae TaxID=1186196 RepID=A0A1H9LRR6_9EURY|nr:PQQ-binding-like beta-propeller repeat protein [Natrinema salaciae]SER14116.1 Outer membrane protein assembly factor BamB, contains PQQ-like beta-propeller repeat [Natrinema salaciae]
MPSRRRLLAGCGLTLASLFTGRTVLADRSPTSGVEWPMSRYDAAGTGYNPDASGPSDDVRLAWNSPLDSVSGFEVNSPVLVDDTLYTVGDEFAAFDVESGDRRFSHETAHGAGLARAPSTIYRTDTVAVTAEDGLTGLNAGGGVELFGRRFGDERWHEPATESATDLLDPTEVPPPVAADGTVYAVVPGANELVALESDNGRERWRLDFDREDDSGVPHRPAVRDGTVFVTGWPNEVAAYDAATGRRRWRRVVDEADVNRPPTATQDGVVVPTRGGVRVLEADDGNRRWKRDLGGNATEGAAAVADGTVFVADNGSDGELHALDLETGETEWSIPYGYEATPVVADGVVYVTSGGYELVGFDAESGEKRFAYGATWAMSLPAVGDGVLYVVDGDRVLAIAEET